MNGEKNLEKVFDRLMGALMEIVDDLNKPVKSDPTTIRTLRIGNRVTIDPISYQEHYTPEPKDLPPDHPWYAEVREAFSRIQARAEAGDIALVTGVPCYGQYGNLRFEDGFECGCDKMHLRKAPRKQRTKKSDVPQ